MFYMWAFINIKTPSPLTKRSSTTSGSVDFFSFHNFVALRFCDFHITKGCYLQLRLHHVMRTRRDLIIFKTLNLFHIAFSFYHIVYALSYFHIMCAFNFFHIVYAFSYFHIVYVFMWPLRGPLQQKVTLYVKWFHWIMSEFIGYNE
jgi:hypothetical protein